MSNVHTITTDASAGPRRKRVKTKKYKTPAVDPYGSEGVLLSDIRALLAREGIDEETTHNDMQAFFDRAKDQPSPDHKIVEVEVKGRSSVGDGLALYSSPAGPRVVVVPYALVGELIEAKIYRTNECYFEAELVKVVQPSPDRNDELVRCQYFTKCSGCQYQMLDYGKQLEIKREVIVNAYKHYAPKLTGDVLPEIEPTVGSPLEFRYRTKLTPHFDVPRGGLKTPPTIGFGQKGRKAVLDIEDCAIGTEVLSQGMRDERARVLDTYKDYKKGATLLLRESVKSHDTPDDRMCVTSTKATIHERVGKYKFEYPANQFFQNNNSILPLVTDYVRERIVLPSTGKPPKYLVDTYCGSGLFAVTCASGAESVIGVEISKDSVEYAERNAKLNDLHNAKFIVGQAERIFEQVKENPAETSIIIDPPRRGCDQAFLDQLLEFRPAKVVYVSCNVHSQARDVEYILTSDKGKAYKLESVRGFDFFPQTHHVESVAVLSLSS